MGWRGVDRRRSWRYPGAVKHQRSRTILLAYLLSLFYAAAVATTNHQPSAANRAFAFVIIGDNRPGSAQGGQPEVFKRMVAEIAALKPAFLLHTGDFVLGSKKLAVLERQYADFRAVMETVDVPVHLTIGNHEITGGRESREFFDKLLGKTYYSFEHANCHFVVLDCEMPGDYHRVGKAQFEWLEKDLAAAKGRFSHIFVCAHEPLYPQDGHIDSSLDAHPKDRDRLAALITKYDAVFIAGHEHVFDYGEYKGIEQIISGGGGAGLYRTRKGTGGFHHYVLVTVSPKSVTAEVFRPGGRKADAFRMR